MPVFTSPSLRVLFLFGALLSFSAPAEATPSRQVAPRGPADLVDFEQFDGRGEQAVSLSHKRHHAFRTPEKLRPRVGFWLKIFSRYGKHNAVIHHRMHPHVIFDVLDLYDEAERMSEVKVEAIRKKRISERTAEIKKALEHLRTGKAPRNALERRVAGAMSSIPGGSSKYWEVLKNGWIRTQRGIRERYEEAVQRSGKYMHILRHVFVNEYRLPIELTCMPFVESSFDYKAYSSVGAAGIWQFMPRTGKVYDLAVNRVYDERRDVVAATRAAARYLLDAYKQLGSWPLAVTSYNHGVYGVQRKIKKLGTRDLTEIVEMVDGQPFGFASQNFFPELLAAIEIYENLDSYFPGVKLNRPVHIARKKLPYAASLRSLSDRLQVPSEELEAVNYALSSRVYKSGYHVPSGYWLNVPLRHRDNLAKLSRGSAPKTVSASSVHGGAVYRVRSGDTLSRISRKYGTSVSELKALNGLRSDRLYVGQTLQVSPRTTPSSERSSGASANYTVRSGDTLSLIARRFRTTVSRLRALNGLKGSIIRVGQTLKVPAGIEKRAVTEWYTVRRGDTLWKISKARGVSMQQIRSLNKLSSDQIRIGQRLRVPIR